MTEKELAKVEEKVARAFRDGMIMGLVKASWTVAQIAAELGMNTSTVRAAIKRHTK